MLFRSPLDSLITQVERGEETFRPDGNTRLAAGDLLVMECKTSNEEELKEALYSLAGTPEAERDKEAEQ